MTRNEARRICANIEKAATFADDQTALESVWMYPAWKPGMVYAVDFRVRYNDILYRCITAHESQETWTPDVSPSLWAWVLVEDGKILQWEQPDSTNPYMTGDKVMHNGQTWISDVDGNVWEPGLYGWSVVG